MTQFNNAEISHRERAIVMLLELSGRNPSKTTLQFYNAQLDELEKKSSKDKVLKALSYYLKGTLSGYVFPSIAMLEKYIGLEKPNKDDYLSSIAEKIYTQIAFGKSVDGIPYSKELIEELGGYTAVKHALESPGASRNSIVFNWKKQLKIIASENSSTLTLLNSGDRK